MSDRPAQEPNPVAKEMARAAAMASCGPGVGWRSGEQLSWRSSRVQVRALMREEVLEGRVADAQHLRHRSPMHRGTVPAMVASSTLAISTA